MPIKISSGFSATTPGLHIAMARFLGLSILLAIVLYGIWPYYGILRINNALEASDAQALAPVVDLAAIQAHYKARVGGSVDSLLPQGQMDQAESGSANRSSGDQASSQNPPRLDADKVIGWLASGIKQLGDAALDQAISLDWVRGTLLAASQRASGQTSTNFIGAIDFAFFESWDRFVIRLGKLGADPTFVILTLAGSEWRVTDITH